MRFYKKYFAENLYLLMGVDSLCELQTWYNAKGLVEESEFIFYQRPGFQTPTKKRLCSFFGERNGIKLYESVIGENTYSVSATKIRKLLRENKNASEFLSSEVLAYIKEKGLYQN